MPDDASASLRQARADVTQDEDGRLATGIRVLFEPVIHKRTDLPPELPKFLRMPANRPPEVVPPGCQRAGRAVVVGPPDPDDAGAGPALPIERKHGEVAQRNVIPRLPEPLSKIHNGRWWHFPAGGVEC